ncbi:hypothetical protein M7I_3349 [Glarea lozoyensis 74030]|uniref:HAM1-like N-terminal domain-containing protein n=1 Tax=Glarea lozoyensis (strain ATCC 74030 / MF5533) TaxID=1104152 RepID=H0EL89_GLAL7|nr:hypothetical protein M7I_3349 [Glarea lozoyensis 74030]
MLTDPEFFDEPSNAVEAIKEKYEEVGQSTSDSTMKKDVEELLKQIKRTFHSVLNDQDVSKLLSTSFKLWSILNPLNIHSNKELFQDAYTIFIPMLITAIQYLPIPRLEISAPEVDLLLENVIIEPGKTVNNSSFLPFRLKVETYNDLTIHKRKFRTVSSVASLVTVKVQGLSVRADEIGYWMRAHKGLIRLADEGIASFELDDRGIDIEMDIEVGKDRLEKVLSLRNVRVKIHHLSYKLRRTIEDFVHAANREVLFARERLRATRISEPKDIMTFIRAVMTRLKPAEDPDLYASVGVTGTSDVRGSVFAGRYAPGSLVKLWEEGARRAGEVVEENATGVGGWRNEIFDVPTASPIFDSVTVDSILIDCPTALEFQREVSNHPRHSQRIELCGFWLDCRESSDESSTARAFGMTPCRREPAWLDGFNTSSGEGEKSFTVLPRARSIHVECGLCFSARVPRTEIWSGHWPQVKIVPCDIIFGEENEIVDCVK